MRPIPNRQAESLESANGGNFSLYFARMTEWRWNEENKLKAEYHARTEQTKKGPKDIFAPSIEKLGGRANLVLPGAEATLKSIHTRQRDVLQSVAGQGGMVWEFHARLRAPFVSGLGSGHPTETGMILDRNSGLPYIPAGAVKGVLRLACALEIAEEEPETIEDVKNKQGEIIEWKIDDRHLFLRRYFGDTDTSRKDSARGQLVFLDVFPAEIPPIKTDIMNPHFGTYYQGGQNNPGPLETESPNPVKFLAVPEGVEFIFRCFASPLPGWNQQDALTRPLDRTDDQRVQAIFRRALDQLGFGAKTAIGYGRFDTPEIQGTDHFRQLDKNAKERKRQEEEDRLYPWRPLLRQLSIDAIDNWDDLKKKLLENQKIKEHQTQVEVAEAVKATALRVKAANPKKWDAERDTTVAKWLVSSGVTTWDAAAFQPDDKTAPSAASTEANRVEAAGFRDFGDWKNRCQKLNLAIEQLTLPEAQSLKHHFTAWGVKDGKGDKKETWKKLNARLKQSHQG